MALAGYNAVILAGAYDVTTYMREYELGGSVEELDSTTFGDSNKEFTPGMEGGESSISGLFEQGAASIDEQLYEMFGGLAGPVTIGPAGSAVGARAQLFRAKNTEYSVSGAGSDLVGTSVSFSHGSAMGLGIWLHDRVARTATGTGTGQDNGASSANGWQASLHVTAVSGTSPTMTVKVQHSTDNSTWADLATFTAATDETAEFMSGTGTVNRYVRAIWTIGGTDPSFTFAVGFARLYQ